MTTAAVRFAVGAVSQESVNVPAPCAVTRTLLCTNACELPSPAINRTKLSAVICAISALSEEVSVAVLFDHFDVGIETEKANVFCTPPPPPELSFVCTSSERSLSGIPDVGLVYFAFTSVLVA